MSNALESEKLQVAQKIRQAILASDKIVELHWRGFSTEDLEKRGDINAVPYNINSRFRHLLRQPVELIKACLNNKHIPIIPFIESLISELIKIERQIADILKQIDEIGVAILPSAKKNKRSLEVKLDILKQKQIEITKLIPVVYQQFKTNGLYFTEKSELLSNRQIELAQLFVSDPASILIDNLNSVLKSNLSNEQKIDCFDIFYQLSQIYPCNAFPVEIYNLLQMDKTEPKALVAKFNALKDAIKTNLPLQTVAKSNQNFKQKHNNKTKSKSQRI